MDTRLGPTLALTLALACTDQKPEVIGPSADQLASIPFAIVAGNHQWLTVGDTTEALTVKVRGANGNPASGVSVSWVALAANAGVLPGADTTDSAGRATARVVLGPQTGTQTVLAISGTDTLRFQLVGRDDELLPSDGNNQYSCGLTVDSIGFCWGEGPLGRDSVGNWKEGPSGKPYHLVRSQHFVLLARGNDHACALTARGVAYCWGAGIGLGTGDTTSEVAPTAVGGGVRFVSLAAGSGYTCGVDAAGQAWCWGRPGDHLGLTGSVPLTVPTRTMPTNRFVRLVASDSTTCGITRQHALLCWGRDLRTGASTPLSANVHPSLQFDRVAISHYHGCAIALDGKAYCWGVNKWGDLGAGSNDTTAHGFFAVTGGQTWKRIGAGDLYSCATNSAAKAYCWGYNRSGRLYLAVPVTYSSSPIQTGWTGIARRISIGKAHACTAQADGKMVCWGANEFGQIGNGYVGKVTPPEVVYGNHVWR